MTLLDVHKAPVIPRHADAVIVGAGLSGLSLAVHLAMAGWGERSVVIVDTRRTEADRQWSFWASAVGPLDAAVSRTFDRVSVTDRDRDVTVPLRANSFRVVSEADLRRAAYQLLAVHAPGFLVVPGEVSRVDEDGESATLTIDGTSIDTDWVFDAAGVTSASKSESSFVISSTGVRVRVDHPVFDPRTPTLMDFRTPQRNGMQFMFVLPISTREAIVEHTTFFSSAVGDETPAVDDYLVDVLGLDHYTIVGETRDSIAFDSPAERSGRSRVIRVGSVSGSVPASTGFGFSSLQRDCAALATSLASTGTPHGAPRSPRHRRVDTLFCERLINEPERLAQMAMDVFANNPGDRVMRFMHEQTSRSEEFALLRSLPMCVRIRAAFKALVH